ncbi:purine-binding chemotaxis protein CheW [Paucidesulfovibrio gracilis DSM 16080]|uniref:Purine-binding chemotaxis protein CheW n=1 Tax=Paucidesulfovibrio gracilis DSM 16080 TaxID=1121449 RepID=A0A1T4XYV6_9BACT|nr:chemotaxis protein CheW [Paucidesulfovibrio gracilis]SKA94696.1 purine-binding chemotaxis protein CheW [Paucidesulfovibrio gracilis DSM 16080]
MAEQVTTETNQYLTFTLGKEVFALDISTVREVLELTHVTRIPRTPDYMRGVINLRGHAVPVVGMRRKLNMKDIEDTINTCIIIVEVEFDGERTVLGALVDSVREVFEMDPESIEAPPKMGAAVKSEYIKGMGRQDDEFIIILDIARIFSAEELAAVQKMSQQAPTPSESAA